jgi:drug/metabolite transporter (DMT)-like permease
MSFFLLKTFEVLVTIFSLSLVLVSALVHASWNLLAKRAGGGAPFVWLFAALSLILYAPFAVGILLWQAPSINGQALIAMAVSGGIHSIYFLLLQKGYKVGDLSLVYPLARGTGPLLSTAVAIAFFYERPSAIALVGALLIATGAFALTGRTASLSQSGSYQPIAYALLIGVLIAGYTLWDKQAVSVLLVPPLLMDYGSNLSRVLLLTPLALRHWPTVQYEWRTHRKEILGIAFLSPLSYILALTALAFTPISYVAPLREISILFGVMLGTRFLAEEDGNRRLAAAGIMVLGAIAIALG